MKILISILFASYLYLVTLFFISLVFLERFWLFITLRKQTSFHVHRIASRWGKALMQMTPGWNIKVSGLENIPKSPTKFLIVANHESAADIFAMYYLNIQFRWISKREVFWIPFVGWAMRWAGYVSVTRGNKESHSKALKESAEWIQQGVPMLFFPEGTRSNAGKPQKFKIGAFKLACENDAYILPVVLCGAGELLRKNSICPKKATVQIKILPPTKNFPGESIQEFTDRVERQIVQQHQLLVQQHSIQTLLSEQSRVY